MKALISLILVLVLAAIAWGGAAAGAGVLFGVILPYVAILLFLVGIVMRVVKWAKAPVPFRIPTTSGQQKSLPWIHQARFDNPYTGPQTVVRMALEVLLFRSLFKNTKAQMAKGPRLIYDGDKWLWAAALVFHWSFLVVLLRHLRFFLQPPPGWINGIAALDSLFQITVPALYITSALILGSLLFLLGRRFWNAQVRSISIAPDFFPLFLLLGIVGSGILMRYVVKTDVMGVMELGSNLLALKFAAPAGVGALAYVHIFLVSVLLAYFPFSKLLHAPGVFLSPTRNLANNNRAVRYVNPWNRPVDYHKFEDWEKEFADEIAEAGYKLERD